ncbi:cysteine desulfurase [Leptonema illini]|uniref:Cysteine desulfurase n=1 Tax=Leptonema illini DSM 21528 TaxID=929563 RepID=H2CHX9_9LEPT|nr:cysteine desulfurase [Leptonema illini]EHQ07001.1 cysteine desulfurase [Leptonema illini DSM 21528]
MLDYKKIRDDFPILKELMNGKPLVFLDSAASSQKPQRVIEAFADYYRCRNANIHRGAYRLSYEATDLYEGTRRKMAKFIGAPEPESIIFTRNTTESINLIAYSYAMNNLREGDEIVVSELEHHSNLVPWMMAAKKTGAVLRHIPLTDDYRYDYSRLHEVLSDRTRIVSVAHMSNAVGTIHDLKRLGEAARSVNAIFAVDGAQGACHLPVDVQAIDCDFYSLSAHKMLGPTGVGVLYGRKKLLEEMEPFLGGGDMILTVSKDDFKPAPLPNKFEAGTPNIAGVVAFAVALEYLKQVGLENIHEHEMALTSYALEEMKKVPGIRLFGTEHMQERGGVVSFLIDGVHPHDIGSILDEEGIAIRAGHHCCEPFMKREGLPGTARASFYLYNGPEDVDALVLGLKKVASIFKVATPAGV